MPKQSDDEDCDIPDENSCNEEKVYSRNPRKYGLSASMAMGVTKSQSTLDFNRQRGQYTSLKKYPKHMINSSDTLINQQESPHLNHSKTTNKIIDYEMTPTPGNGMNIDFSDEKPPSRRKAVHDKMKIKDRINIL